MGEFIISIAILNLGLGFAMAVYLGRRYCLQQSLAAESTLWPAVAAGPRPALRPPRQPAVEEPSIATVAAALAEPAPPRAATAALRHLHAEVDQFHVQMATLDEQLRQCTAVPQRDTVEACLQELLSATEEYGQKRAAAQQALQRSAADRPQPNGPYDALDAAIGNETKQIEATTAAVTAFDYQADLGQGCRQLVEQTDLLLETNVALRNTLAETIDDEPGGELAPPDPQLPAEEAAGTLDRAAAGNVLTQWCASDPPHPQHMAAALVDLDQFALINRRHGHGLGDRILQEVAAMLLAEPSGQPQVSRFHGNAFLVLLADTEARAAANFLERIRQTVELTRFRRQQTEIRLTLSGAITELRPGDTPESLLARLKTTLTLAKRYGRNRCFLNEGEYPSPVIPPTFALTEKERLL